MRQFRHFLGVGLLMLWGAFASPSQWLLAQKKSHKRLINNIIKYDSAFLKPFFDQPSRWGIQFIYTRIDRPRSRHPRFREYRFQDNPSRYFYPASTVKLPIAILALERLRMLAIPGLDRNSTFITEKERVLQTAVCNDPTSADGRPTIAHYIKKILLVSDNDAFNRLYEWLGRDYINERLHQLGYNGTEILHRLSLPLSYEENRYTNPVVFLDTAGHELYREPGKYATHQPPSLSIAMGDGYMSRGQLVREPFDFSLKNRLPLAELHHMVQQVLYPRSVPERRRFLLTADDLSFLRDYMSRTPRQSDFPSYDTTDYGDNYVKFLYYGAAPGKPDSTLLVYNKVGDAYGFLIDAACFRTVPSGRSFLLSAVIYCNSDGIFNDDHYDYDNVGFPFLRQLGRAVYAIDSQRRR